MGIILVLILLGVVGYLVYYGTMILFMGMRVMLGGCMSSLLIKLVMTAIWYPCWLFGLQVDRFLSPVPDGQGWARWCLALPIIVFWLCPLGGNDGDSILERAIKGDKQTRDPEFDAHVLAAEKAAVRAGKYSAAEIAAYMPHLVEYNEEITAVKADIRAGKYSAAEIAACYPLLVEYSRKIAASQVSPPATGNNRLRAQFLRNAWQRRSRGQMPVMEEAERRRNGGISDAEKQVLDSLTQSTAK